MALAVGLTVLLAGCTEDYQPAEVNLGQTNLCDGCGVPIDTGEHITNCGISGHCALDGKVHGAAGCGTDGHFECDGKDHRVCGRCHAPRCNGEKHGKDICDITSNQSSQSTCPKCSQPLTAGWSHASPCGVDGHYRCDGKNHSGANCGTDGHFECDGADHSGAACKISGHYKCDGNDHGDPDCIFESHKICDGQAHTRCEVCVGWLCNGNTHGYGLCYVYEPEAEEAEPPAPAAPANLCPGCQQALNPGETHAAPCGAPGHHTCSHNYSAAEHTIYHDCGMHRNCDTSSNLHWFQCPICQEWGCASANAHTPYPCRSHYACNGTNPTPAFNHTAFDCGIHADCDPSSSLSPDPNAHNTCPDCKRCTAEGHDPDCSQNTSAP